MKATFSFLNNRDRDLERAICNQVIEQIEDWRNWEVSSCVAKYIPTGDQYWIGNGAVALNGYRDTRLDIGRRNRRMLWKYFRKMIRQITTFKLYAKKELPTQAEERGD